MLCLMKQMYRCRVKLHFTFQMMRFKNWSFSMPTEQLQNAGGHVLVEFHFPFLSLPSPSPNPEYKSKNSFTKDGAM